MGQPCRRDRQRGGLSLAERLSPPDDRYRDLLGRGLRPAVDAGELRGAGLSLEPPLGPEERVALFELEGPDGPELWAGRRNFYTITRYNHSALYALAVVQLARRIRAEADLP